MPNKIAETYQVAYQAAIGRGLDPLAAKVEALDAVAATLDGEAYIEKVISELTDADPYFLMTDETRRKAQALLKEAYIKKVIGELTEANPGFLISDETYREAEASLNRKLSSLRGMASTVIKDKEQRRWVHCGETSVWTPPIDNQRATELRHGWAERALDLLTKQKPFDADQLADEWTDITLSERKWEENRRRHREYMIALLKVAALGVLIAWIAAVIWGPRLGFIFLIPSALPLVLIYGWLTGKLKKRLNRRNEV